MSKLKTLREILDAYKALYMRTPNCANCESRYICSTISEYYSGMNPCDVINQEVNDIEFLLKRLQEGK